MFARVLSFILVGMVMLSPLILPLGDVGAEDETEEIAEWTFIVYLDADNNLEGPGIEDMDEMEFAGSTDKVNIVAIVDRASSEDVGDSDYTGEGDWQGLRIYHVQKDENEGVLGEYIEGETVWYSEEEPEIEPNMGDPETLINYTTWVMDRFPAEHYLIDFWNHGGAFWGICWDDSVGDGDALNMTELSYGLDGITNHIGRKIDVIGFDACLMAQAAVLYQIKDYCDVAVASGFVEPGDGWPYETILPPLVENPSMTPEELGTTIANEYIESYSNGEDDPSDSYMVSMTAFDMGKFENTAEAISEFGMAMAVGPDSNRPTSVSYYEQLRFM
ncbi:MAG: hypothetical protein KAT70_07720, partial [Thermoplasmata archaeon]|nr:hypothetical protein [Thermoplasmata archaeon]